MTIDRVRSVLLPALEGQEDLPEGWDRRLTAYLDLLRARNQSVNLVSRAAVDRLEEGQLLPSLAALRVVPPGSGLRVLDVGSGGGFPGIPLAILRPGIRLDLVEATGKKCTFLQDAVRELRLTGAIVHWCRVEAPIPELLDRAPFDVLLARAVGSADLVRNAALPLLAADGSAWIYVPPDEEAADLGWPVGPEPAVTALRRLV